MTTAEVAAAQRQTGSDYMAVREEDALEASRLFRFGLDLILTFVFGSVSSVEQTSRQSRSASLCTTNTPASAVFAFSFGGGGGCLRDGGHNLSPGQRCIFSRVVLGLVPTLVRRTTRGHKSSEKLTKKRFDVPFFAISGGVL